MKLRIIAALLLLVPACSGADDTPAGGEGAASGAAAEATESEAAVAAEDAEGTFTIVSGAAADEGDTDIGVFDFYPSEVQARPGETLRFENGSGAIPVPHTVTLGTGADVGTQIPPPVAEGQVPAVWGTCVSEGPLAPDDADCPNGNAGYPPEGDTVGMEPFADQGFYNSGIFEPGQTVVVPIADDAAPGMYSFVCYLHPATMEMTVEVVAEGETVQTQSDLDATAQEAIEADPAISGVFGGPPFPSTTYALRFPQPGRYAYLCPIDPGMAGVVNVE
ncbi:MAG TPA: hypothetical protein VK923_00455 [Euzebyales bacterium]|nr:hypothetical protein [Euzebyales bacterium]